MSVVIETTLGDITVDLYISERPRACLNFLKLCKVKYYNYNLFHTISRGFIAQTGDPTGSRSGGESIYGVLDGLEKKYFEGENEPRIKHTRMGLISFVGDKDHMVGSQFFLTLGEDLTYLDEKHCVFGEVVEGFDVLDEINEVICDTDDRPYQDVRITHTVILNDPMPDPKKLKIPSRSPSPSAERLQGGRIAPDEEIDETQGKTVGEIVEIQAEREAKARATILEMVGDIPDADMAPPENVLFVCKLNPVTTDEDLEIIFNRFGKIKSCEVIRDRKSGDSLQYAFIEFQDRKACEDAYFKMDNILIDDRRIHVDFSQSVSKVKWLGKGRGVAHYDERGQKMRDGDKNIGRGNYKYREYSMNSSHYKDRENSNDNYRNVHDHRSSDQRRESKHSNSRDRGYYEQSERFREKNNDRRDSRISDRENRSRDRYRKDSRMTYNSGSHSKYVKRQDISSSPKYHNKEVKSVKRKERHRSPSSSDESYHKPNKSSSSSKTNGRSKEKTKSNSENQKIKQSDKKNSKRHLSEDSHDTKHNKKEKKQSKYSSDSSESSDSSSENDCKKKTLSKKSKYKSSSDSEDSRKKAKKKK